jgi:hypothetical protein
MSGVLALIPNRIFSEGTSEQFVGNFEGRTLAASEEPPNVLVASFSPSNLFLSWHAIPEKT